MPDDRNKQQGRQGDMDEGQQGGHQAPGRNPQDDKSTGAGGRKDHERQDDQGGGSNKEGGQNEQTRR
jgi:hypothetical protein